MASDEWRNRAFSLIEVLIAVAIIALLISLSVPAIQASREAARKTQCTSNQRQFGIAFLNFESHKKAFPSSITMRIKGPLTSEPEWNVHTFVASLLPYLEAEAVKVHYDPETMFCAAENQRAIATVLNIAICPSSPRETTIVETKYTPSLRMPPAALALYGSVFAALDAKYSTTFRGAVMDYGVATQAEDGVASLFGYKIPKNASEGLPSMFPSPIDQKGALARIIGVVNKPGVVELSAQTRSSQITDGLSHTFMMTEVAGRPQHWQYGERTSAGEPLPSAWADPDGVTFEIKGIGTIEEKCIIQCGNSGENGDIDAEIYSFHSGVNFLFADGHVETIDASIDRHLLLTLMTPSQGDNR